MIDQIILSCNDDETYLSFWDVTSWAYWLILPETMVHLAFVTDRAEDDPLVVKMRSSDKVKVTLFKPIPDMPTYGQAKMARFILASQQEGAVCYLDDIDLIPLSADFIYDAVMQRPENVLLCVGEECNGWQGTFPVSQMTAEGYIWKQFINPKNLEYEPLVRSWTDYFFHEGEKLDIDLDMSRDRYFSDERRIRRMLRENPVPILSIRRGYENYLDSTIDRHTYNKETDVWEFDREKLKRGEYVNVHGCRPFTKFEKHYEPIIQHIKDTYE